MSQNPLGREIIWDYIRINYGELEAEFGLEDPRLGHMLIDIASTFENEFLFYEVIRFFTFFNFKLIS